MLLQVSDLGAVGGVMVFIFTEISMVLMAIFPIVETCVSEPNKCNFLLHSLFLQKPSYTQQQSSYIFTLVLFLTSNIQQPEELKASLGTRSIQKPSF